MGLLGSIAGGLFGAGASSMQNAQNRQNVRETNQMNYKINQMNNHSFIKHSGICGIINVNQLLEVKSYETYQDDQ